MSHPKKFEIADKILDARSDKKQLLFQLLLKMQNILRNEDMFYIVNRKRRKIMLL